MTTFETVALEKRDQVTEIRFHTNGGPLVWTATVHREIGDAFAYVAGDPDTKVVIVTGTGEKFCTELDRSGFVGRAGWEQTWWEGKRLLRNLLEIDAIVIGAINGLASLHAEIPLLADIVLAADTTVFSDTHVARNFVPGDGVQLIWPYLLGAQRAKYFLLTGQEITAAEALAMGVVNEVLPQAQVAARAWELALQLAAKPRPLLRYTREVLNGAEREQLLSRLGTGLALEGLALADMAAGAT